jgi:hypothetical protein
MPIPVETWEPAIALLKPVISCPNPTYINANIDAFLRASSPAPLRSEPSFVPIFSRDRLPCPADPVDNNLAPAGSATLPHFASLVPAAIVEDEYDHIANIHLRDVDGWRTPHILSFVPCLISYRNVCTIFSDDS